MTTYVAPVADVLFLLFRVLHWDQYLDLPPFKETDYETVEAVLREAAKFSEDVLLPLNAVGDREGCLRREDGSVACPQGFKRAYQEYSKGGWVGLAAEPAWGGQGLPYALAVAINEFSASANMAFTMYPGLSQSAIGAIAAHGDRDLRQRFLPGLISGDWAGTMNLTEPQCGTDLGLIRTQAVEQPDGSYFIEGQKIFISAGEHDLCDNIIHLVLARIDGAPSGTRGLSMFLVPKINVLPDGTLGEKNSVSCGSIESKMGIHGNATCVMNYDGARGWLIGERNRGLQAMFVMMNEARLGVANQGLALSEIAYQNASIYAKGRLQGRSLSRKDAGEERDPLASHPDIRRMLLTIRSFNEAARGLLLEAALKADIVRSSEDSDAKTIAEDRLGLLTPVLKGILTDRGFENVVLAQQIYGGHGYIVETGVEQFVRDARIAMIYEGANGIQALDLVGRKLAKDNGRAIRGFFEEVAGDLKASSAEPELKQLVEAVSGGLSHLRDATTWFMNNAFLNLDNLGAGAYDYMHLFGLVALGHMWLKIAEASLTETSADNFRRLRLARFFAAKILPETATRLTRIRAGAEDLMSLPADAL